MIICLPGKIRVENLLQELTSVYATLLEAEVDTLTGVSISMQFARGDAPTLAASERQLMQYPDPIRTPVFLAIVMAMANTLQMNGVEAVVEVELSLQAWRGDERAQVWGDDGILEQMVFDLAPEAGSADQRRIRRPGTTLKFRPRDKDVNLFAVMFGHDD